MRYSSPPVFRLRRCLTHDLSGQLVNILVAARDTVSGGSTWSFTMYNAMLNHATDNEPTDLSLLSLVVAP